VHVANRNYAAVIRSFECHIKCHFECRSECRIERRFECRIERRFEIHSECQLTFLRPGKCKINNQRSVTNSQGQIV